MSQVFWYSCNSAPPRPHIWKDCCSQPFSKPDSLLQKLLNARSGEIWLGLCCSPPPLPRFLPSSFSVLSSSYLISFSPFLLSQPAIFTSSSSFSLKDCLSHSHMSIRSASPGSLGSWNVSCHEWECGWEGKAHDALNKDNRPATRLPEGQELEDQGGRQRNRRTKCALKELKDYTYKIGF